MIALHWLVLIISLLIGSACGADHQNLRAVVVIFRHGNRNIFAQYPNDPYNDDKYWPEGIGQLTKGGINLHYKLGQWFKKYYAGFLPDTYSDATLYVRSTNMDRTLMSAAAHLAGLMPPKDAQVWNPDLLWQPIPIHTAFFEDDPILGYVVSCKKYNTLFEALEKSPEISRRWNQTLADYIKQHSGKHITTFMNLLEIYDTLVVEDVDRRLPLPEWTREVYPDPLHGLAILFFTMGAYTRPLTRLKMGPFLHDVISHFDVVAAAEAGTYTNKNPKYRVYSAHDMNLVLLLKALEIFDGIRPPYAAAIVMELRQDVGSGKHFVNVLYKNQSDVEAQPHQLAIKGCDFSCNLDDFKSILKPVTVDSVQFRKECSAPKPFGTVLQFTIATMIFVAMSA